jgi:isocitrate dehydrogenase
MPYDPSITQRVRKAVKEATDQYLAVDVLLEHNERQDKLIAELNDKVGVLIWHHVRRVTDEKVKRVVDEAIKCALREQRLKVRMLTRVVWVALVPVSMAAGGLLIELLRKH